MRHKHSQPLPISFSSSAGRDRRSLVQAHIQHSPGSRAHIHSWLSQVLSCPLCPPGMPAPITGPVTHPMGPQLAVWASLMLTADIHILDPQARHTCRSPKIPAWTLGLLDTLVWSQGFPIHQLVQLEDGQQIQTHPTPAAHNRFREDTDTHSPPAAGTRHIWAVTCGLAPATDTETLTHPGPPSSSSLWGHTSVLLQGLAAKTLTHPSSWYLDPTCSSN